MKDKPLDIPLLTLFGIGGIAILAMTWTRPMATSEWVISTLIGFAGPLWVSLRILLKFLKTGHDEKPVMLKVISGDK